MGAQNDRQESLQIKVVSGQAQSQELFDFQSDRREQCIQRLQFPSILAYSDNGIIYQNNKQNAQPYQPIFQIKQQFYHKIIFSATQQLDFHNQIWRVISANQKHPIYLGDQLKLGKIKIKLKAIITQNPDKTKSQEKQETQQLNMSHKDQITQKNLQQPCRICFDNSQTLQNPLLSLCNCTGSVKNVHYDCLKDWINNSIQKHQSANCLSYTYTEAKCELCKMKYQNEFTHNGNKFMLYQFQKLKPPYALFQNLNNDESMQKNKISVFMIKLQEGKQLSVGRNNSSQVVLGDISVSRSHCTFLYQKGQLFVKDRKSKFGTLIKPSGSWQFQGRQGLQLQIGSKLICLGEQKTLDGCCCSTKPYQFHLQYNRFDDQI